MTVGLATPTTDASTAAPAPRGTVRDFVMLTKPGITRFVVGTVAAGYWLGARGPIDGARLAQTLLATLLVASGTNALNQWWERDVDGRMRRTSARPLPAGRLAPGAALGFALVLAVAGIAWLAVAAGWLPAALALATTLSYVACYTPLKKRTPLNTLVGAVPGALPILGGWAAATGGLAPRGWALFAVLFLWQLPHFLALAWMYKDDYARGRLRMLSVTDPDGRRTGRHALAWAVLLAAASMGLAPLGIAGDLYLVAAGTLGAVVVGLSGAMALKPDAGSARRLFLASVIYLPVLLAVMALDKVAV